MDDIINNMRPAVKRAGIPDTRDNCWDMFMFMLAWSRRVGDIGISFRFPPGTLVTGFNFRYPEFDFAIPTLLRQRHEDTLATSKHMNTIGRNIWNTY